MKKILGKDGAKIILVVGIVIGVSFFWFALLITQG